MTLDNISIQLDGIGHILADKNVSVPLYQRSYAWEEKHVLSLFQDIGTAIRSTAKEYFLGSIVAASNGPETEVVDGQQRLTTTAILLGAIRDYFFRNGDRKRASQIENQYLITSDFRTQEWLPKMKLNSLDRDFFVKRILVDPENPDRKIEPNRESHKRLKRAAELASKHVNHIVATTNNPTETLADWVDYITRNAKIIWVQVPDHANAFTIFETLNDRGLDLAISDLLKNFLFNLAGDRIKEVQLAWVEMVGCLIAVDSEDQIVNFIRHIWSSRHGLTREKELFSEIKVKITSKQAAVDFGTILSQGARLYAAILNPEHELWHEYGPTTRAHMTTLNHLRMTQMRPTIMAIMTNFQKEEIRKSMRMLVSWAVRFLISGDLGSSTLENLYSQKASEITNGKIATAKQLADAARDELPNDLQFREAFRTARVSKSYLARYYLQVLERKAAGEQDAELVPNTNAEEVNLEHILPQNPSALDWSLDLERAEVFCNRIGNMVLLTTNENSRAGNAKFSVKRETFRKSKLKLTREVADYEKWTPDEIEARQLKLAQLAAVAWPI